MILGYTEITEAVKSLNYDDKIELNQLLKHYLIEEKRDEIFNNFLQSRNEINNNKVKYHKSFDDFRNSFLKHCTFRFK